VGSEETGVHFVVPMSRDIPVGIGFVCRKSFLCTCYKGRSVDLPNSFFFMTKELVARASFLIQRILKISKSDY
jgi:hypothetical protein